MRLPLRKVRIPAIVAAVLLLGSTGVSVLSAGAAQDKVTTSNGVVTYGQLTSTRYTVGWLLRCNYAATRSDDPIVHQGMPGMSHSHDFFGNTTTNANSTYSSMLAGSTRCGTAADTAGYWQPGLQQLNKGAWSTVVPDKTGQQIYYRSRYAPGTVVRSLPADLRIVVGNAMATSVAQNAALQQKHISWYCDHSDVRYDAPPLGCASAVSKWNGMILENVEFPSCWDGTLTHSNDSAHMAFAPDFGNCPAAFPIPLPRISLKVKFTVATSATQIRLTSGGSYSSHADFWNTWQPKGIDYLVKKCLNAGISCGTNPIAPTG